MGVGVYTEKAQHLSSATFRVSKKIECESWRECQFHTICVAGFLFWILPTIISDDFCKGSKWWKFCILFAIKNFKINFKALWLATTKFWACLTFDILQKIPSKAQTFGKIFHDKILHPLLDGIGGRITAVLEKVKLPKKSSFLML